MSFDLDPLVLFFMGLSFLRALLTTRGDAYLNKLGSYAHRIIGNRHRLYTPNMRDLF